MTQPMPDLRALVAAEEALQRNGFAVVQGLFPESLLHRLASDAAHAAETGRLRPATTGPHGSARLQSTLRGDAIAWLERDGGCAAVDEFLDHCDALRARLSRTLLLGLESVETHFALYPPGAGYARHIDRFRSDDARVLSLACYLNEAWEAQHDGALRLHAADGPIDVLPRLGTSVLFLSAEMEHEVLPSTRPRYSIAGWFRRRERRGGGT